MRYFLQMRKMKVFLSYSSADSVLADKIFRWLGDQAISVWFDKVEIRPGDSLLEKISEGISESDVLIALITKNSIKSLWASKEIRIALTQEVSGKGPMVIPLLVKGFDIPTLLADKSYIPIEDNLSGIDEIIPAVFRESFILNLVLNTDDFTLQSDSLQDQLYSYYRSNYKDVKVRIDNNEFNNKVIKVVEETISKPDPLSISDPKHIHYFVNQVREDCLEFFITLPLFWNNLSYLLSQGIIAIFNHLGRSLDTLKDVIKFVENTFYLAHYELARYLNSSGFPYYAKELGYDDIANFISRFSDEEGTLGTQEGIKKAVRHIYSLSNNDALFEVEIRGDDSKRIYNSRFYLPASKVCKNDRIMLQSTCPLSIIVDYYAWYTNCLPQVSCRFLYWVTFREGKPIHELDYFVGIEQEDYEVAGLP